MGGTGGAHQVLACEGPLLQEVLVLALRRLHALDELPRAHVQRGGGHEEALAHKVERRAAVRRGRRPRALRPRGKVARGGRYTLLLVAVAERAAIR